MSTSDDYLYDREGTPDPDVARLEALLAPLAHDAPLDELRLRRASSRAPWIAGALALVVAAAVLVIVLRGSPTGEATTCTGDTGFRFTAHGGTVACEGTATASGVLPIGGVLDTGTNNAELVIADIGSAQLFAGTRVRLDRSEANTRHQLHLERGRMHAIVNAPPRIFAVTTPSTSVVDLGCEYTIDIDARGQGSIVVQSGLVELENGGALIIAPAGSTTRLLAGRRASLPIADGASTSLRAAVEAIERGSSNDAIAQLLAAARAEDAITVVNLAALAAGQERHAVLARLAELAPPPASLSVADALASPSAFEVWREEIVVAHLAEQLIDQKSK